MTLDQLLGDDTMIGRMDDAQFDEYWTALGKVIRLAARHKAEPKPAGQAEQQHQEMSCTSASTERRWSSHMDVPATAIGFGKR